MRQRNLTRLGRKRHGLFQASVSIPVNTGGATLSVAAISATDNSKKDQPAEQPSQDYDCFCCCAHALPGAIGASIVTFDLRTPSFILEHASVLSPSLRGTFHPPRFA
jgi:hypothetical protein